MLKERINDGAFLRLIQKWLKAGILDTSGEVIHPATGTPQGGIVSPILANVYLHYALDLWFEKRIKRECNGAALIIRYADDFVCAFQYQQDAQLFYQQLNERLGKFGLEVSPEKTRILPFSRRMLKQNETFDFSGFEFRRALSRKLKPIIKRRTSRKKLRASIAAFTGWIKTNRNKKISKLMRTLRALEKNNSTSCLPVVPSPAFHPPAHIPICAGGCALATNPHSAPYCGIIYFHYPYGQVPRVLELLWCHW